MFKSTNLSCKSSHVHTQTGGLWHWPLWPLQRQAPMVWQAAANWLSVHHGEWGGEVGGGRVEKRRRRRREKMRRRQEKYQLSRGRRRKRTLDELDTDAPADFSVWEERGERATLTEGGERRRGKERERERENWGEGMSACFLTSVNLLPFCLLFSSHCVLPLHATVSITTSLGAEGTKKTTWWTPSSAADKTFLRSLWSS